MIVRQRHVSARKQIRFSCEPNSSTCLRIVPLAEPHAANVSRSPRRCRYLRESFPESGSSGPVKHFQDATNLAVSDRLCVLEGGTSLAPSPYCVCVEFHNPAGCQFSDPAPRCHPRGKADRWEERKAARECADRN